MASPRSRRTTTKKFRIRRLSDNHSSSVKINPATEHGAVEREETEPKEDPTTSNYGLDYIEEELLDEPTAKEKREEAQKERFQQIIDEIPSSKLEGREHSNEYWVEQHPIIEKVCQKSKGVSTLLRKAN